MVSIDQIRSLIESFGAHRDGNRFLSDYWPLAMQIRQDQSRSLDELVQSIESRIALVHAGHLSVVRLRQELLSLIHRATNPIGVEIAGYPELGSEDENVSLTMLAAS